MVLRTESVLHEPTETVADETVADERIFPEVPTLKNFNKLLTVPEGVSQEHAGLLETSKTQITKLFKHPVITTMSFLSSEDLSGIPVAVIRGNEKELNQTIDSLNLLDSLLGKDYVGKLNVEFSTDEKGTHIYRFTRADQSPIGNCGNELATSFEIKVRNGLGDVEGSYTPMQLNFIFKGKKNGREQELTSLRADLHNREKSKKVQLDMDIEHSPEKYVTGIKHQDIAALSSESEEETRRKFGIFLSAFETNLIEGNLLNNENIQIGDPKDKHKKTEKQFSKNVKNARNILGVNKTIVDEHVETEVAEEIPIEEQIEKATEHIIKTIDAHISVPLHEVLDELITENPDMQLDSIYDWMINTRYLNQLKAPEYLTHLEERRHAIEEFLPYAYELGDNSPINSNNFESSLKKLYSIASDKLLDKNLTEEQLDEANKQLKAVFGFIHVYNDV